MASLYPQMAALLGKTRLKKLVVGTLAELTGNPVGTIKTWLHRARKELAGHLQRRSIVPQVNHELH